MSLVIECHLLEANCSYLFLNERVKNEEMGHASMTSRKHEFPPYGRADTPVRVSAQERGGRRDERRK